MNILIACEESQVVALAFRKKGHDAYSCDILPCSGKHPEFHIQGDVLKLLKNSKFKTQDGETHKSKKWDLMIAHPPCTYLAVSGARWFYDPRDKGKPVENRRPHPKFPNRRKDQKDAVDFVKALWHADVPKIVIENPIGILSTKMDKPTQIIQPWWFGDAATKTTCLWIKGLPVLKPLKSVQKKMDNNEPINKGEVLHLSSGRKMQKWYADALVKAKNTEERRTLRSKTFLGFAKAMAQQWG